MSDFSNNLGRAEEIKSEVLQLSELDSSPNLQKRRGISWSTPPEMF